MTQHMRSNYRQFQTAAANPILQNIMHCRGGQRASGGPPPQKQLPVFALGTARFQVLSQHGSRLVRQRQLERLPGFMLRHLQRAGLPVEMVQSQTHQLTTAQSVAGSKVEHGEVADTIRLRTINGTKQCHDLRPRQRPG